MAIGHRYKPFQRRRAAFDDIYRHLVDKTLIHERAEHLLAPTHTSRIAHLIAQHVDDAHSGEWEEENLDAGDRAEARVHFRALPKPHPVRELYTSREHGFIHDQIVGVLPRTDAGYRLTQAIAGDDDDRRQESDDSIPDEVHQPEQDVVLVGATVELAEQQRIEGVLGFPLGDDELGNMLVDQLRGVASEQLETIAQAIRSNTSLADNEARRMQVLDLLTVSDGPSQSVQEAPVTAAPAPQKPQEPAIFSINISLPRNIRKLVGQEQITIQIRGAGERRVHVSEVLHAVKDMFHHQPESAQRHLFNDYGDLRLLLFVGENDVTPEPERLVSAKANFSLGLPGTIAPGALHKKPSDERHRAVGINTERSLRESVWVDPMTGGFVPNAYRGIYKPGGDRRSDKQVAQSAEMRKISDKDLIRIVGEMQDTDGYFRKTINARYRLQEEFRREPALHAAVMRECMGNPEAVLSRLPKRGRRAR